MPCVADSLSIWCVACSVTRVRLLSRLLNSSTRRDLSGVFQESGIAVAILGDDVDMTTLGPEDTDRDACALVATHEEANWL